MAAIVTHTLPPLNPMSTAPRDGTRIIVMGNEGQLVSARHDGVGWDIGPAPFKAAANMVVFDGPLLGWWPMPEVRGE